MKYSTTQKNCNKFPHEREKLRKNTKNEKCGNSLHRTPKMLSLYNPLCKFEHIVKTHAFLSTEVGGCMCVGGTPLNSR